MAQQADVLFRVRVGARDRGCCNGQERWMPSADSAVEVEHAAERTIIGVHAPDVRAMLRWIAPALLRQIGEESLGSRGIEGRRARRGASIILTSARRVW